MEWAGRGEELILQNVRFLQGLQAAGGAPMYVGGLLGCRGDAYTGEGVLPGESKQISFTLYAQDMSYIGTENKPVLEPGLFEVMAGGLTGQFRLV